MSPFVDENTVYNDLGKFDISLAAPLTNFLNEKYSRDLSKNVRNSKRIRQEAGEYIGGKNTPFGYKRDPADKHHLIIDEYEAIIIKKIFNWYVESGNQKEVIRKLYENNIPKPSFVRNYKTKSTNEKNKCHWDGKTIHDILVNQVYIGTMVQHKYQKKSFRQKNYLECQKMTGLQFQTLMSQL